MDRRMQKGLLGAFVIGAPLTLAVGYLIDKPIAREVVPAIRFDTSRAEDYEVENSVEDKSLEVISEEFVNKIIQIESNGDKFAKSKRGARGLMQIMPDTWKEQTKKMYGLEMNFNRAYDPILNRRVGEEYLNWIENYLSDRISGWSDLSPEKKQELIAAGYNGGAPRLVKRKGDINQMPEETRDYVRKLRN